MLYLLLQGWRSWKSAKAVALLAATALAVGIGSATAIYTMVEAVLLKPLPWPHGERFVSLFGADVRDPVHVSSSSWPDLLEYRQRTRSFEAFGAYRLREFSLTAPGEPQHLSGIEVEPSFVNSLGVNPIIGRWFGNAANGSAASESEDVQSAVISSGLWKRLGGDPGIVGTTLTLDRRPYTVTGVMPTWFRLPLATTDAAEFRSDIWVPLNPPPGDKTREELPFDLFCYARLKPGVTMAQADADVKRVAAEIVREFPQQPPSYTAVVINVLEVIVKDVRPGLLLLFGAAGALLLITCANVAGLLLARAVVRARETALRVALGAAAWQLALQYLAEGLLISVAGAAGGIVVSLALVRVVLSVAADYLPRSDAISVNWTALAFALGAAMVSSMLLSLAPLWQALRTLPNEALSEDVHASAGSRSRRLSRSLVVAEIALAFTLLASSALILAHLSDLLRVPTGFDPNHLMTFRLNFNEADYPDDMKRRAPYQKRLLEAIEQIPGVSHAAFANQVPIEGCCYTTTLSPEGRPDNPNADLSVSYIVVDPGYFQTLRIPLLNGRLFDGVHDRDGDTLAMVIDHAAAKRFWPDRDPIGALGRLGGGATVRVIGIVGNVRNRGFREEAMPEIYLPGMILSWNPMRFIVRSSLPAATLVPQLRRAVRSVDAVQPIYAVTTMDEIIQGSLVSERLESFLTMFFALTALLMAALGIYGVVSYSVRHRTVEIGTRMALGAESRDVARLVIGEGLTMAAYGIGIGGVAVFGVARLLSAKMFGIHIDDARPFLFSTGIVVGSTALAGSFPAWRATLVSPMVAIRRGSGSTWQDIRRGARAFAARMSSTVSGADDAMAAAEGPLLAKFVESSRRADSFRQAIAFALATLRETINCESAWLLEKHAGSEYRCDDCAVPANGLLIGRLTHYPFPLPLSEGDFDAWAQWAAAEKLEHATEIACLRKTGTRLAVPLLARNEIPGVLLLGAPIGRGGFSAAEKRLLQHCATQFTLMMENAHLTERIVEQEKLRRDLHLAVEVQRRLLPGKPPATATVALAGMSLPARSIGGDYYDFLDLGDHRVGIALADVAGKGIPAALIMSVVQASLRILATEEGVTLSSLAARMNHFLHRATGSAGSSAYATFFYAQIDERRHQLRYVNAGHNPPYLLRYAARSEKVVEELPAGGTVIGLFPQTSYEEATVDLHPGDLLMAFTDGVLEAMNPKDEEFGEERLRDLLCKWAHLAVDEMASQIAGDLKTWIADAAQYDDLTFILVKVNH